MSEAAPASELPTTDCTVCTHAEAAKIDEALLGGTPIRTVAGTFALSRSAVGRHRQNHLSAESIGSEASDDRDGGPRQLRLVDVHHELAELADRLEKVIELAARTRKATAATAAMRELRQTLEAIGRIQADPELQKAAALDELETWVRQTGVAAMGRLLSFVLQQFGFQTVLGNAASREVDQIAARLLAAGLRALSSEGIETSFLNVDTSAAVAFMERRANEQADRVEAEVQRRVEAELRRREAQARPALEARPPLAIEGEVPAWTA